MLTRPRPEKLKEAFESIQQLSEGMKQMEEVERVEAERMEFETLRQQYFERHGRPLISVFSEIQPHNRDKLSSQAEMEKFRDSSPQTWRAYQQPDLGRERYLERYHASKGDRPYGNPGRNQQENASNFSNTLPPRHLSKHPMINGSEAFRRDLGILCIRCGLLGHTGKSCREIPLEQWEQSYSKDLVFPKQDIDDSNWRNTSWRREAEPPTFEKRAPQDTRPMTRQENETPNERHTEEQMCRNAESMTYSDFVISLRDDFEGCRLQSNSITLGFEDQASENRVLKQKKVVRFKEREKDNVIHLDAFLNVGNDKKRARPLDIRDILNDDVQDPNPEDDEIKNLIIALNIQKSNHNAGLEYVDLNMDKNLALYPWVDGSLGNNKDLRSQIGYVLALGNETRGSNSFKFSGNLIHWSSTKCKRVTRSVLASELYAMTQGIDIAIPLCITLNQIVTQLVLPMVPLIICTDSFSLYECLVKLGTTKEKRLMIDVMAIRESYERRELTEIRWIHGKDNPADAMTKEKSTTALQQLVETNQLECR
ncbi:hypothetical protein K3495_g4460 [Podosphaera aphanis]|nr:hypothetical protein K3495_g4460 [Podosphaera aphanis]